MFGSGNVCDNLKIEKLDEQNWNEIRKREEK